MGENDSDQDATAVSEHDATQEIVDEDDLADAAFEVVVEYDDLFYERVVAVFVAFALIYVLLFLSGVRDDHLA